MPDSHDQKRERERIEILGELHGEVMVFQPVAVKEISVGGAQLDTNFPLQLNSLHDFRLTLGDRSVVVKGRVAGSGSALRSTLPLGVSRKRSSPMKVVGTM